MNLLVTDYCGKGDDVMVFAEGISALTLGMALSQRGQTFCEIYPVKDEELQYYVYEPLWLDDAMVQNAQVLAQRFVKKHEGTKYFETIRDKCSRE
ncbi:MAG: hypothetical protein IJM04_04575 [Prevotella sp.]|nr:hypothetical protein [Prevotella sp.]